MQADDFEKKIRDKMKELELVPAAAVWEQVSARISKEKRRRRVAVLWWLTGFLLLLSTAGLWLINKDNSEEISFNKAKTSGEVDRNISLKKPQPDLTNAGRIKVEEIKPRAVFKPSSGKKKTPVNNQQTTRKSKKLYEANDALQLEKPEVAVKQTQSQIEEAGNSIIGRNISAAGRSEISQNLPPHKFYLGDRAGKEQPAPASSPDAVATKEKTGLENGSTSPSTEQKVTALKKQSGQKWSYGVTFYGGVSDNVTGFPFSAKASADVAASPSTNGPGGQFNNPVPRLRYDQSYSYGLGFFISRPINKKISLSVGVDYHYYSAKSKIGGRVTTPRNFFDSVLEQNTIVNEYYVATNQSATFVNKYHKLELPVNLQFRVNKNEDRPLLLTAGISPGVLIGSRALYVNPNQAICYIEKNQFRNFQLSAQTGLLFTLKNFKNYRVSAGPVFQYGFTNQAKRVTGTKQHLLFTGLKANITLK